MSRDCINVALEAAYDLVISITIILSSRLLSRERHTPTLETGTVLDRVLVGNHTYIQLATSLREPYALAKEVGIVVMNEVSLGPGVDQLCPVQAFGERSMIKDSEERSASRDSSSQKKKTRAHQLVQVKHFLTVVVCPQLNPQITLSAMNSPGLLTDFYSPSSTLPRSTQTGKDRQR